MDVSVVIVNYNTRALTISCIDSVLQHTSGITYEIILVENGSGNFETDEKRWDGRPVTIVVSKDNLGFAKGNNLGIQFTTGKYILLLNSDTYLRTNAILTMYRYLEVHPKVGALSARLIFPDGRHQSVAQRFPSIKYQMMELFRLQKLFPKRTAGRILLGAFFDHKENIEAGWVWGACFMFRRELPAQMPDGKLDEEFFMYYEDMQWCLDIRRLGYQVHYCADAEVVHLMGGSSANKEHLMAINREKFLKKNFSPIRVLFIKTLANLLRA